MRDQNLNNNQGSSPPPPPQNSQTPPAPNASQQPAAPAPNAQPNPSVQQPVAGQPQNFQSAPNAQFAAANGQPNQPGFGQNQFQQQPKQPNAFVESLKAQWTSIIALKSGSFENATAAAVPHKFFWIINFVLVSLGYGLIGANILKTLFKATQNAAKEAVGSVFGSYVPEIKLEAGAWFGLFFLTFAIVFVLLIARVGLMQATYATTKSKVSFGNNANIYASTLGLHIAMALIIGILTFIPVPPVMYILLAVAFVVGNVVGVLSEISLYTAARAYSPEKSPLLPFLGFLSVWYLLELIAVVIYARVAMSMFGEAILNSLGSLTDYLSEFL